MNDVEVLNDILKRFDNSEKFKRFVLLTYKKDKNWFERLVYEKLAKKYDTPSNSCAKELVEVKRFYLDWALITEIIDEESQRPCWRITPKGRKALHWRFIAPQKPEYVTDKGLYWINTGIAILALIFSNIAIFKSCI